MFETYGKNNIWFFLLKTSKHNFFYSNQTKISIVNLGQYFHANFFHTMHKLVDIIKHNKENNVGGLIFDSSSLMSFLVNIS